MFLACQKFLGQITKVLGLRKPSLCWEKLPNNPSFFRTPLKVLIFQDLNVQKIPALRILDLEDWGSYILRIRDPQILKNTNKPSFQDLGPKWCVHTKRCDHWPMQWSLVSDHLSWSSKPNWAPITISLKVVNFFKTKIPGLRILDPED